MRRILLACAAFVIVDFAACLGVDGLLALTGSDGPAPLWVVGPAVYWTGLWVAWRWDH